MKSGLYKKRELRCKDIEQFPNLKESMGGHYAGENYGSADIALQYGGPWDPWSNWNADDKPHLQKNAEKYRKQKHRHEKHPRSRQQSADQPEGKMAETLENTGQASSQNESAGVVSGTFVHCDSWLCHLFFQDVKDRRGTSSDLSVCGRHCTGGVIAFTSGVGFSYKEELVMDTLADYVEQMRSWTEEIPAAKKADPVLQEEIVDKITSSIKQTAASGSHFSKMLTPEEEKIMREIIREFMT